MKWFFYLLLLINTSLYADNPCGVNCTTAIMQQEAQVVSAPAGAKGANGASLPGTNGLAPGGCTGTGGACQVFKTTVTMTGNLDTNNATIDEICGLPNTAAGTALTKANCICAQEGARHSNGTWRAWLSTATVDAPDNILYDAARVYVQIQTGTTIAAAGNLLGGTLASSIDGTNTEVWTGTTAAGVATGNICNTWIDGTNLNNGEFGLANVTNTTWSIDGGGGANCDEIKPIYCFEAEP